jgi:flagellar protein FlaG
MLIQNTGNIAHTPQPARPASDGAPNNVVVATPANVEAPSSAQIDAAQPAAESSPAQLQNAVDSINKTLKQANRSLEFSVDESTNKQVFKLVDTDTGDTIRQYPSEEMLAISRAIDQVQQGLLLKQEA